MLAYRSLLAGRLWEPSYMSYQEDKLKNALKRGLRVPFRCLYHPVPETMAEHSARQYGVSKRPNEYVVGSGIICNAYKT